jgi:hypothetical protein
MAQQAKVEDLEVFRRFKVAMLKFAQAAEQSLTTADADISRTRFWLESEQMNYWTTQIRLRTEAVTVAAEELRKKKMYKDFSGRHPDATQEQKNLDRCKAALETARGKVEYIRKAIPALDRAADLYRGGVSRLRGTVSADVPNAVALLDRLAERIEEYLKIEAPSSSLLEVAPIGAFDETVARAIEAAGEAAKTEAAEEEKPPEAQTQSKEAGDVASGQ